jgi:broad specificity phosphatase PhoE
MVIAAMIQPLDIPIPEATMPRLFSVSGLRASICVAVTILCVFVPAAAHAQKMVLLVRHAERADGGAGVSTAMTSPADPPLSTAGDARATRLAAVLADAGITAIFTTEFRRTKDTAKPLADKLKLTPEVSASRDAASMMAKIKAEHADGVVLIVGHSNTLPALIKAFGGPDVKIADQEYDNLFVVVPQSGAMTRIRY